MVTVHNKDGQGFQLRPNPRIFVSGFNRAELLGFVAIDDLADTIYLSARGPIAISAWNGLRVVECGSLADLSEIATILESPELTVQHFGGPVSNVVFDTFSEFQELILHTRASEQRHDVPTFDDWSWLSQVSSEVLRKLASLSQTLIFLGVAAQPNDSGSAFKPGALGSISGNLPSYVDYHFMLDTFTEGDETHQRLTTVPTFATPWVVNSFNLEGANMTLLDVIQSYQEVASDLSNVAETVPNEVGTPQITFNIGEQSEPTTPAPEVAEVTGISNQDKINAILGI